MDRWFGEIIDEDIDTLDDSEAWVGIEATANGYEEKFGDLTSMALSSGTGSDDDVLKNSSDSFDNVALWQMPMVQSLKLEQKPFTVESNFIPRIPALNSAATGYQLYIEQGYKIWKNWYCRGHRIGSNG